MNPIKANIPNSITCINLLAGCLAIITAFHGNNLLWGMPAYLWAYIFIAIGAIADFLDGFAARALHAYSILGKSLTPCRISSLSVSRRELSCSIS